MGNQRRRLLFGLGARASSGIALIAWLAYLNCYNCPGSALASSNGFAAHSAVVNFAGRQLTARVRRIAFSTSRGETFDCEASDQCQCF
jgi:hypothetical protein